VSLAEVVAVGLVGCGVMGRRHAAVVHGDPTARLACAVDIVDARAEAVAEATGASTAWSDDVQLAIIATPTASHVQLAAPLLARGLWVLVEKPVATDEAEAGVLDHPRCLVGHCERFNPAVRAGAVHRPTHLQVHREGPWSGRSTDIDVLSDLMVHDLDLLLGWAGHLECTSARGWRGPSGQLDRAEAELRGQGLVATVVADRMGEVRRRTVSGHDAHGSLQLDLARGSARRDGRVVEVIDSDDALSAQWRSLRARMVVDEPRRHGVEVAVVDEARAALRLASSIRERIQRCS